MFEISTIEVPNQKENTILKRNINLDKNLDCFLMISSSSNSLAENLLNHSLESIIDKISKDETYNDFWIALENINSFLKNWRQDQDEEDEIDMIISVLNENNLMFSNIWKSTVYLINKNSEIIELTERNENKKSFLFISNWNLANSEIIISSTVNILKYLSKSDIMDWMILSNDIEIFNKNIKNILQSEIVEKNCIISSLKYKNEILVEENPKITAVKDIAIKILDTNISKKIISKTLLLKDKISNQNKTVKNFLFIGFILFLIILLYSIVSWIFFKATQNDIKQETEIQIEDVKKLITEAKENVLNPWFFNNNIEKAENLIKEIEEKKLYANDILKIKEDINLLKKQFNKIEIFNSWVWNLIYAEESENNKLVIKNSGKTYIITKKGIIWPIVSSTKPKTYVFNSLSENEEFVNAWVIWQDIYLLTNTSKIVKFNKSWVFSFASVFWQQSWEKMKSIDTYHSRIYTLWTDNQILKHEATNNWFWKWIPLLKEDDIKSLWETISMSIDWWFYLVWKDITRIKKFFSDPYRIESLMINKLPKNYVLEEWKKFQIKSNQKLSYVYMLLNDKIFVFQTNANDYKNTRSLTYISQIEWWNERIIDFFVDRDWEITVLNKKWLYKLNFEISEDKLILK